MEQVTLICHHCDFTHPGDLGGDVMKHGKCAGSGMPSRCYCPGVMRTGCPCSRCHGTGWYAQSTTIELDQLLVVAILDGHDYSEMYCDCPDGVALEAREAR